MKKIILITAICAICAQAQSQWSLTGNAGTNTSTNFIGTTDNVAFKIRTNNGTRMTISSAGKVGIGITSPVGKLHVKGNTNVSQLMIDASSTQTPANPLIKFRDNGGNDLMWIHSDNAYNVFVGLGAGNSNNAIGGGLYNTFIGRTAGYFNTIGYSNTATGIDALSLNTKGYENTATGVNALWLNTTASQNTAIGGFALLTQSYDPGSTWISANTAVGFDALRSNEPTSISSGINNTAVGHSALRNNTTGSNNTANGVQALYSNNTGFYNTANGMHALYSNTNSYNTANGYRALYSNTTGGANTAIGFEALYSNSVGQFNIANGVEALHSNTTASRNIAIGRQALYSQSYSNGGNDWESNNLAIGYEALLFNQPVSTSTGIYNTAVGNLAMRTNTFGHSNTAIGYATLYSNTYGIYNTAIGQGALYNNSGIADRNTAIGYGALSYNVEGDDNIAIGYGSGVNGIGTHVNTISIGNPGYLNWSSNYAVMGNTSTAWIGGQTTWFTFASDARVKKNVKEDVMGLEFISKLRPVTYNLDIEAMRVITGNKKTEDYPEKYDVEKIKQSGFIAQEVEQAAKETGYSFSGITIPKNEHELYTMSYSQFVVPLVKAVQELSKENEDLKSEIEIIKSVLSSEQKQKFDEIKNENRGLLEQNSPNPFNTQTEIKFQLPEKFSSVQLIIADANGKQVRTIELQSSASVIFHAGELSAGTYSYSLIIDGVNVDTKQMVLTK